MPRAIEIARGYAPDVEPCIGKDRVNRPSFLGRDIEAFRSVARSPDDVEGSLLAAEHAAVQVGVAKIDITPDYPIRLTGYAVRKTESEGVEQRLWAKALATPRPFDTAILREAPSADEATGVLSDAERAVVATNKGEFTIELDASSAPVAVANFVLLARCGYFDGVTFHRVIPGFVAQAGDPQTRDNRGDFETLGTGGPGYRFEVEFPPEGTTYTRYMVAMANAIGVNVPRVFSGVFMFGAALAALGGALGTPVRVVAPGIGAAMMLAMLEQFYGVGVRVRNRAFDLGVRRSRRAPIPVISVGNIVAGGAGKTPFTRWLVQQLIQRGRRAAILHGGYGSDEPELHRQWLPSAIVLEQKDRVAAAAAAARYGADVVVLDDAFQHRDYPPRRTVACGSWPAACASSPSSSTGDRTGRGPCRADSCSRRTTRSGRWRAAC